MRSCGRARCFGRVLDTARVAPTRARFGSGSDPHLQDKIERSDGTHTGIYLELHRVRILGSCQKLISASSALIRAVSSSRAWTLGAIIWQARRVPPSLPCGSVRWKGLRRPRTLESEAHRIDHRHPLAPDCPQLDALLASPRCLTHRIKQRRVDPIRHSALTPSLLRSAHRSLALAPG